MTVKDEGALCHFCFTTAVECQHIFRASPGSKKKWCCFICQLRGPEAMHTEPPREA